MAVLISSVEKNSPAEKAGISVGESLVSINGNQIKDVLDYRFYIQSKKLSLELLHNGEKYKTNIRKSDEYADIGLEFSTYLMDKQHSCKNKCVFCFVDQMPKGMRDTLYFKDDDSRMSFLFGNYITLTNLTDDEVVASVLVEQDVASLQGSLLEVIHEFLLVEGQFVESLHLVTKHLDIGK